ncbi:MAG: hypothetical protein KAG97_04195, partial [Victivallales bacterium]|nr:hypothetical protein [Victivallales bacterium]
MLAISLAFLIPVAFSAAIILIIFKKSKKARISAAALMLPLLFLSSSINAEEASVVLDNANYDVSASNIEVKAVASFAATAKAPGETLIVPAPIGITGELPDNSNIRIERKGGDYYLKILSAGSYKFKLTLLLPLKKEKDGAYAFPLPLPNSRKNSVRVEVGLENTDIAASDAVSFNTTINKGKVTAVASFVPGSKPLFRLFPLKRKVRNESVRFFANTMSLANFAGGVVEIKHVLDFNIAQGELAKFAVKIPPSMGVTGVSVPDLGAWRYNPATNLLEVFLTQAHHDKLRMLVTTQIADCVLPYEKKVEVLNVVGAGKQHGTLGVSASRGVRVEVGKSDGMSRINSDDFATRGRRGFTKIRQAFRYFSADAFVKVKAFSVIPELRVSEKCVIAFEEEKTTLVSDMALQVSKAGLFSVTVEIPENFDVDKVTGNSVRHWDEVTKNEKHLIVVHFTKRVLG